MHRVLLILLFLSGSVNLFAHPGVGIVMDKNGNLFYTDLTHVWMIKPDGSKSIAVPNVHTHELYIDKEGKLYGEHLWYNGEQLNTWGHYFWCRLANGEVKKVKDSTAGFPEWYSFTRDGNGNMYYVENEIPVNWWKIDTAGHRILLGSKSFSNVGRLHVSAKGDLYFNKGADLYWVPVGDSIQLFYKNAANASAHSIMHTWSDDRKNIYIATGNEIKKIDNSKFMISIYKSAGTWKPASGVIAANGDFWVLEYNDKNEVRVNKVSATDRKGIVKENAFRLYLAPVIITVGILSLLYFLLRKKK